MADFDAKQEKDTIGFMVLGFDYESSRSGGNLVAASLAEVIKDTWCRLSSSEQQLTAAAEGSTVGNSFLRDGNHEVIALQGRNGGVIPVRCEKK